MIRDTSREIFKKICENGLLSKRKLETYGVIVENPGATIKEVCMILSHRPETSVSPIFAMLMNQGVIFTDSKKPCSITGNNAYSWFSTDRLPIKFEKPRKIDCAHCKGKGFITESQGSLF